MKFLCSFAYSKFFQHATKFHSVRNSECESVKFRKIPNFILVFVSIKYSFSFLRYWLFCRKCTSLSTPTPFLTYTLVGPVTPTNPLQGCGNQSLWQSGSVNKREMGVLSGLPEGIMGPGRAGWCTSAAGCASSVEA